MKKVFTLLLTCVMLAIGVSAIDTFTNPVAPGADPFILKDDDGTYYLYGTGGDVYGYRVYSSKNLVEWTSHGYCLFREDVYTDPTSTEVANAPYGEVHNLFWAPEVLKYEGKYYLVYSAQRHIGIAVSDSPLGPFKGVRDSFLLPYFRAIDGNFFVDKDGKVYLYFSSAGAARFGDYAVSEGQNLWGAEMDMKTLKLKEDTIKLLVEWNLEYDPIKLIEGPFMIENDGKYYLTFSSGDGIKTHYSVHYAIGDSPLGSFERSKDYVALICDDLDYADKDNPHLYGTAHHSFVEAPNGKDIIIAYQCHRTNFTYNESVTDFCAPRSVCIDHAWFEGGKLYAGSKANPTVPTATAQPLLEGTTLERQTYLTGAFEKIPTLPKVYVSYLDGSDENDGTKKAPLRTLERAISSLKKGGTVVLTQSYTVSGHYDLPTTRGPLMITSENANVVFTFNYLGVGSSVYFDNIVFAPQSFNDVPVVECNFCDVTFGEGVGTVNNPYGEKTFPYLVGGRWNYTGASNSDEYLGFRYAEDRLTSEKNYTVTVLGGKWEKMFVGTANYKDEMPNSAPNGRLVTDASGLTPSAPAAQNTEVKMTIDSLTATVNGTAKTLDAAPIIRNSRTMLPVRFVAENLGATVSWDDATKTVSVKSADTTIEIVIGATTAKVNGKEIILDSPAFIESSRTYLPVRVVAENLGATVSWDDATKTATLTK